MTQEEKIDKMFDVMMDLQRDMASVKFIANSANETAETAMTTVTRIKDDVSNMKLNDDQLENELK